MRQYRQIKEKHADTVLLFRLGDFYETFGDDAVVTAKACGITLTKRNNGSAGEIPLAGFPHHQLDAYLPRLVRAGHRVAVCEQLEDPKQAKGIVKRDVVEVVTPGVVLYDKLLEHTRNTYIVAISAPPSSPDVVGIAVADVSTGLLRAGDIQRQHVASLLESLQPAEVLVNKAERDVWEPLLARLPFTPSRTRIEPWIFEGDFAGGGVKNTGYDIEYRSLASAVRANDGKHLALIDRKTHIADGMHPPKAQRQIGDRKDAHL